MSQAYDVLIRHGHVIDPRNSIDGISDVAVKDGLIAAVGKDLPGTATKEIDASGLYVTPGLLDIHLHAFSRFNAWLYPDQHCLPYGVTTCVDTGSSGWQHFPGFVETVIDTATMRVLAFINIVGAGMAGRCEQDAGEMVPEPCADMIKQYPQHVVGSKSAHYGGSGWESAQGGIDAARLADSITMVDFAPKESRTYEELLIQRMAPGDIHTHLYASHIPLLDENLKINDYVKTARERGIIFDTGHGGGSFWFRIAVPAMQQGFQPDTISTDLHRSSRMRANATMDITMSKFLAMGMGLQEVIYRSTQKPAEVIRRPELGNLSIGAGADVAILEVREGEFGFVDSGSARHPGTEKIECRVTLRDGRIVWDDYGITTLAWDEAGDYKRVE
ncbi:MAG: amidohydrolase/deacetylase family metallohydrolase [Gemmatimonadetes bacterium]|nr:amidohydrolase/deacetylase family metallohydrolase [Gemmatimonadota bacterium]MBT6144448.1 amidohydrolase/deacetylase family metallohydrolase [Gemmatimonadota bacterium]MBT7863964.1 amidohydrolase/deacetylase family metallohydrolase [Gemmatimonadota bacterium]